MQDILENCDRVIVIGGLGFIGSHLVDLLIALGKDVVVADSRVDASSMTRHSRLYYEHVDIRVPETITSVLRPGDLVFHAAANANGTLSVQHPGWDYMLNSCGTFNVAEAARHVEIARLVYLSSASVYGRPSYLPMDEAHPTRPFIPYGASKLQGEITLMSYYETYDLPVVIGRPSCVYGRREDPATALVEVSRFVRWHLRGEPIQIVGDPERKTRDFIHVSDLTNALLVLADRGHLGEVYNLGSGTEHSMLDVVATLRVATGRPPTLKVIPEITHDTYRLVTNIGKLRELGYEPGIELTDGVLDLIDYLGDCPERPLGETIFTPEQVGEAAQARRSKVMGRATGLPAPSSPITTSP